jgi:hypothetical protein
MDLKRIKEYCDKATPGTWRMFNGYSFEDKTNVLRVASDYEAPETTVFRASPGGGDITGKKEDFEFISHARTDMPLLIAEIERLKAEIKDRDDVLAHGSAWPDGDRNGY